MGSRKRSRPNPKVETPLQSHKEVVEEPTAKAAVPCTDGSVDHTSTTQDSTPSTSNSFIPDVSSVKVCSLTLNGLFYLLISSSLTQARAGMLVVRGLEYKRLLPQPRWLEKQFSPTSR